MNTVMRKILASNSEPCFFQSHATCTRVSNLGFLAVFFCPLKKAREIQFLPSISSAMTPKVVDSFSGKLRFESRPGDQLHGRIWVISAPRGKYRHIISEETLQLPFRVTVHDKSHVSFGKVRYGKTVPMLNKVPRHEDVSYT
jgi:hypothetical protein